MPNKYGHKNYLCYIINYFGTTSIAINKPKQLFLTLMLVFMANNDANNGKDIYLQVRVSIIICRGDPQRTSKQLILLCFWQC